MLPFEFGIAGPVNNSLIDYPVKRYDMAFELASDVINENFTARN